MPSLLTLAFLLGRRPIITEIGPDEYARLRSQATAALPAIIAQLPDLNGKSGARFVLEAACALVAFHRALPGRSAEANANLLRTALLHAARWVPPPIRRFYRWMFFSPWYHRRLLDSIAGGGGFAGEYVPGQSGKKFGVEYSVCGIQLFLTRIGASDLGPHICGFDDLESEVFGLGLVRTGTIGRGANACDFRWTKVE